MELYLTFDEVVAIVESLVEECDKRIDESGDDRLSRHEWLARRLATHTMGTKLIKTMLDRKEGGES